MSGSFFKENQQMTLDNVKTLLTNFIKQDPRFVIQSQHEGNCASDSIQIIFYFADGIGPAMVDMALKDYYSFKKDKKVNLIHLTKNQNNDLRKVKYDSDANLVTNYLGFSQMRYLKMIDNYNDKKSFKTGAFGSQLPIRIESEQGPAGFTGGTSCSLVFALKGMKISKMSNAQWYSQRNKLYGYDPTVYDPIVNGVYDRVNTFCNTKSREKNNRFRLETPNWFTNRLTGKQYLDEAREFQNDKHNIVGIQVFCFTVQNTFHTFTFFRFNNVWHIGDNEVGFATPTTWTIDDLLNNQISFTANYVSHGGNMYKYTRTYTLGNKTPIQVSYYLTDITSGNYSKCSENPEILRRKYTIADVSDLPQYESFIQQVNIPTGVLRPRSPPPTTTTTTTSSWMDQERSHSMAMMGTSGIGIGKPPVHKGALGIGYGTSMSSSGLGSGRPTTTRRDNNNDVNMSSLRPTTTTTTTSSSGLGFGRPSTTTTTSSSGLGFGRPTTTTTTSSSGLGFGRPSTGVLGIGHSIPTGLSTLGRGTPFLGSTSGTTHSTVTNTRGIRLGAINPPPVSSKSTLLNPNPKTSGLVMTHGTGFTFGSKNKSKALETIPQRIQSFNQSSWDPTPPKNKVFFERKGTLIENYNQRGQTEYKVDITNIYKKNLSLTGNNFTGTFKVDRNGTYILRLDSWMPHPDIDSSNFIDDSYPFKIRGTFTRDVFGGKSRKSRRARRQTRKKHRKE